MTPRHTLHAVAEVWATSEGRLQEFLRERRLAAISAGRPVATYFGAPRSAVDGTNARKPAPDYLTKAEEFCRALEARGLAIVERERVA